LKPGLIEPKYGRTLRDAFEARLDSDYGPNPDLNESSTQQLISNAVTFVERLAQILNLEQEDEVEHDVDQPLP